MKWVNQLFKHTLFPVPARTCARLYVEAKLNQFMS